MVTSFKNLKMLRMVLIDLSGTLHIENQAIPGAVDALKKLLDTNLKIKFVTNTTKESQRILYERLKNLGFKIDKKDIYSSLSAAKSLLVSRKLKPLLLLSPEALEDFQELLSTPNDNIDAVVVGLAPTEFHYEKLNEAFRYLLNGAKLIAIHAGKYYKRKDCLALGPGCFVKGLEYSAQCTAEIVGKPNKTFFISALDKVQPEETIMIGDDVTDDIQGAMNAGMRGFLVQTGKYQSEDENKIIPKPSQVFPSFVEAVEYILEEIKQ